MQIAITLIATLLFAGCASRDCHCGGDAPPHLTLQLPSDWTCQEEGSETVCKTAKRDRMIIYTIKERGTTDTLDGYKQRLTNAKLIELNGQAWVDSTKEASELEGYTTRYLATVDGSYAALVTFSAQKDVYKKFGEEMSPIVSRLILRR
jgi:type IV pilus biogenesis protein CpaD/CtpE